MAISPRFGSFSQKRQSQGWFFSNVRAAPDRPDLEAARIEALGQQADACALAGGVPALEQNHHRHARVESCLLEVVQATLQTGSQLFPFLARHFLGEIDLL